MNTETNHTSYMHMDLGEGKATFAIMMDDEAGTAYIGASFCSPRDQFSRKKGRLVSAGRAGKGKHLFEIQTSSARKVRDQVREQITACVEDRDKRFPTWSLS